MEPDQDTSTGAVVDRPQRAPEAEPVRHRHFALGDRDEARQPRLGREQVVVAVVELVVVHAVADREQLAPAIEQKPEVHLVEQLARGLRATYSSRSTSRWQSRGPLSTARARARCSGRAPVRYGSRIARRQPSGVSAVWLRQRAASARARCASTIERHIRAVAGEVRRASLRPGAQLAVRGLGALVRVCLQRHRARCARLAPARSSAPPVPRRAATAAAASVSSAAQRLVDVGPADELRAPLIAGCLQRFAQQCTSSRSPLQSLPA